MDFEGGYPCKVARRVTELYPKSVFHIVVASESNAVIKLLKHQRIATMRRLATVKLHTSNNKYAPYPPLQTPVNSVNVNHYSQALDNLQQM